MRASWSTREGGGSTSRFITAVGFAPVLFHVTPHFFLGFGPQISRDFDSTPTVVASPPGVVAGLTPAKLTIFGLQSTIGGWF